MAMQFVELPKAAPALVSLLCNVVFLPSGVLSPTTVLQADLPPLSLPPPPLPSLSLYLALFPSPSAPNPDFQLHLRKNNCSLGRWRSLRHHTHSAPRKLWIYIFHCIK